MRIFSCWLRQTDARVHLKGCERNMKLLIKAITVLPLLVNSLAAAKVPFPHAEELYNRAQYQAVIEDLRPFRSQPEALRLTGRSFFMLGNFTKAAQYFQKVLRINPSSSIDFEWLGKSFARRADTSNALSNSRYAAQASQAFERAAEFDPANVEALTELLAIYVERRGLEKARVLVERIAQLDAHEGLNAQQKVMLRIQQRGTYEEQLRMALDLIPNHIIGAVTLAPSK